MKPHLKNWKTTIAVAVLTLTSCQVGVDGQGNYSLQPYMPLWQAGIDYLIREERPDPSAKSGIEETVWAYQREDGIWVDETGAVVPEWN